MKVKGISVGVERKEKQKEKEWEDVVGDGVTGSGAKITSLAVMTVMVEGDVCVCAQRRGNGNGEIGFKGEK